MDNTPIQIVNTFNPPYAGGKEQDHHRHLRVVVIDVTYSISFFTAGKIVHRKCIEGLPEGSKYIGAIADGMSLSVFCVFEHPSFAPVPSGHYIPVQAVRYEKVDE
jgi:hypothetical protein